MFKLDRAVKDTAPSLCAELDAALDEFEARKADIAARTADRRAVVAARLAALEAEHKDLVSLERTIQA